MPNSEGNYLWFVTFVTHNSRISERMVTYGIKRAEPLIFDEQDRILIREKILEVCDNNHIKLDCFIVLPDHVHIILGEKDLNSLSEAVRKIKGYSSREYQRIHQWESGQHVWAQKFHKRFINSDEALYNIRFYINNNELKHAGQWD